MRRLGISKGARLLGGTFVFLGIVGVSGTAFSQANAAISSGTHIDLTAIIVAVINLAFPAVAGVATYLINAHVKNQRLATMLSNAIQNGVGMIQQRTAAAIKANDPQITIQNPNIAAGVQYVVNNAQEAIDHFNIPQDRITQKLEAKLGLANIATNLAATASPSVPGAASPLAPVQ